MNQLRRFQLVVVVATLALIFGAVTRSTAATYIWTNTASGNFTDGGSWDPNGTPGSSDTANLPLAFTGTVTVDGSDRTVGALQTYGPGTYLVNMNSGATLATILDSITRQGNLIVSNGTVSGIAGGVNNIGGQFGLPGFVYLNGGNLIVTNAGNSFTIKQGAASLGDSIVQVNAGSTFRFSDPTVGFGLVVGADGAAGDGRAILHVNGGTAHIAGVADYSSIGRWGANKASTAVVSVASGTLNSYVGSTGQRIVVGARAGGLSGNPNSQFVNNLAQLNVSGTGTLNADGYGLFVGRNTEQSPGEFNVTGGTANLGGAYVGNFGKLSQSAGVVTYTSRRDFLNESDDSAQHLFMTGGLTRFQGITDGTMTIDMGDATAGNVLGNGFYNVEFGGNDMSPFTITLPNIFYGRGTASGGNGIIGDAIMDLTVWTNTTVIYNAVTYSGTNGPNSLYTFASLAQTWGWDVFVAIPEPTTTMLSGLGALVVIYARRHRRA
jgi:hypothetical protein